MHESNKETILGELQAMSVEVAGPEKSATAEPVPLDDIFSGQEPLFSSVSKYSPIRAATAEKPAIEAGINPAKESGNGVFGNGSSGNGLLRQETRQTAILEKLRQSGNCRLRDLQEVLPDCSERTLRYDLETLSARNLVERVGSGGPSVFYRLRQAQAV